MILFGGVRFPIDRPSPGNVSRLDHNVLPMIDAMHRNGIRVDIAHMESLGRQLGENMTATEGEIARVVGKRHAINPASPPQVAELLFKKLRVQGDRPVRLTDSGAESTGADQLQLYEDCHPVVRLILDWRHYQKLKGTYADKMAKLARMDPEGRERVHTRFKTTRTATGRLASEDPNLQNVSTRARKGMATNWGQEVRKGFTATPGWVLVSMDLSQIEFRWLAHYSGEPSMVNGYCNDPDFDMHTQNAADCGLCPTVGCNPKDPVHLKKHRLPAKAIGFGVVYLMGPDGLQLALVDAGGEYWPVERCKDQIDTFYDKRPYIRDWQGLQFQRIRRHGMVWDMFGRHRLIPQSKSVLGWQVREGEREGANMPIQSAAQGSLKVAMAHLHQLSHQYNRGLPQPRVRSLLQVHDELIFEANSESTAKDWISIAKPVMETAVPLIVPVASSADIAFRWGDLK
jgi:DNA polymerase-1